MKIFTIKEFEERENPSPQKTYKTEILTGDHNAKDLGGIFGLLGVEDQGLYHYHKRRESIIIIIKGAATEVIDGKEIPIKAGDVLYISAGEKHKMKNTGDGEVRYLEFFTYPPVKADFTVVNEKNVFTSSML